MACQRYRCLEYSQSCINWKNYNQFLKINKLNNFNRRKDNLKRVSLFHVKIIPSRQRGNVRELESKHNTDKCFMTSVRLLFSDAFNFLHDGYYNLTLEED